MHQSKSLDSFLSRRVRVLKGDIAKQNVDVIVNAANSTLFGGGVSTAQFTRNEDHRFWKHVVKYAARAFHAGCLLVRLCYYRRSPPCTLCNSYGRADYKNRT